MQDRFKFRGVLKLATQNIVIYSSFLKNYDDELVLSITEDYFKEQVYQAGYKLTKEDWKIVDSYSDQDDYYPMFNFYCERVDQCIGLKDESEDLIYENDIIELDDGTELVNAVIEWDNNAGCWNIRTSDTIYTFDNLYGNEMRVIGNIHENADLLENKDE